MTSQNQVTLDVHPRVALGRKNKALRRAGFTPIHVYGHGEGPLTLQSVARDLIVTLAHVGHTAPLTLRVEGGAEHFVMVREIQRHPVHEHLLHVDFVRISRTEKVRVQVPVHIEGEAPATRAEGLSVSHDLHEVEVEALPHSIPSLFTVDISLMEEPDATIHVRDLEVPAGVEMISDPDAVIVHIAAQRGVLEEEAPVEDEVPAAEAPAPAAGSGDGDSEGDAD